MIKNQYNQSLNPILETNRERNTHRNLKNVYERHARQPAEQLFSKQVVIQLPLLKTTAATIFTFLFPNYKTKQNKIKQKAEWVPAVQVTTWLQATEKGK